MYKVFVARIRHEAPGKAPAVITIGEAAEILGVCEMTLRRWDRAGKFTPHRHPVNGYRCYRREAVLKLRKRIETGKAA